MRRELIIRWLTLYLNHDQLPSQKKTNMTSCFLFLQPSLLALQKLWQDSRLTHMRKTSLLTSLCVLCIRVQQGLLRYMRMVWVGSNASLQVRLDEKLEAR
jgi:hypothetical protein